MEGTWRAEGDWIPEESTFWWRKQGFQAHGDIQQVRKESYCARPQASVILLWLESTEKRQKCGRETLSRAYGSAYGNIGLDDFFKMLNSEGKGKGDEMMELLICFITVTFLTICIWHNAIMYRIRYLFKRERERDGRKVFPSAGSLSRRLDSL